MTIQILTKPGNITPRLEYTIDFIFGSLGFNWKIASIEDLEENDGLILAYLHPSEFIKYTHLNCINIPNFDQLHHLELFEQNKVKLYIAGEHIPILGKRVNKQAVAGWRKSTARNYFYKAGSKCWQIEFDLLANIFFHLSRFEERWRNFADESESDWAKSVLAPVQHLQVPVVDVLLKYLKQIIFYKVKKSNQSLIRILPWSGGEHFGVALTHDVDLTRGISLKEHISLKGTMAFYDITGQKGKKSELKRTINGKNEAVWSFEKIIKFYKEKNWRATFFFLAKSLEGMHFRYNIASEKFIQLFKKLKTNQHEIALHPSLNSFDNPANYAKEKRKLEKYANGKMIGMRQHYLRAKFPRLWVLAESAGLKYDSSLGYNFQAGFRSGTTVAHHVYNFSLDQPLGLIEFPLSFFEYSLPQKGMNEKKSIDVMKVIIKQVEKYSGLLTVLFHPNNFSLKPFKQYWHFLTVQLKKKKIYVTTLSEHLQWFQARREIRVESKIIRDNQLQIIFKKPKNITQFSFEVIPDGEFEKKRNVKIQKLKKNTFLCESNLLQIKLNYLIGQQF